MTFEQRPEIGAEDIQIARRRKTQKGGTSGKGPEMRVVLHIHCRYSREVLGGRDGANEESNRR